LVGSLRQTTWKPLYMPATAPGPGEPRPLDSAKGTPSASTAGFKFDPQALRQHSHWLIAIAGLLAMYLPTFWDLFHGIWASDAQGHGPIVLAISLWLLWKKWPEVLAQPTQPAPLAGWPVFIFGLLLYLVGRSQDILLFEVGALIWLISAYLLLLSGGARPASCLLTSPLNHS
jgi:hypothetical protein